MNHWLGYVVAAAFVFGLIYFFIIQRDKAYRLLAAEKAKSEGLLRRIEADLAQAARIQKDLLPKESPKIAGFDISGANVPCYEVGGDYYDFVPIDPDRIGVVVADVSGKGISASLLMASLRAALLAEVRPDYDLRLMASHLSDFVYKSFGPTSFVTFFFAELDRRTTQVRYVNAGHNPPFILDRDGHARRLEISGFPLGMFAGSTYEARTSPLASGELAVLFTDGVIEGRNERGEDYSEDKLQAFVRERRALPAAEICREVITDVRDYACGTQPCDDITLVILKRTGA
jgi:sigma-B regulation protein RsbU (phosphoserine phosphatase)